MGEVVLYDLDSKNQLKICMQTHWIVDVKFKEKRKKIFGRRL